MNETAETVVRVVAYGNGLVFVFIPDHAQHRPEDFIAGDIHIVGDVAKYRRPDEVALFETPGLAGSAGHERCALLDSTLDEPLNLVPLRSGNDRTHPAAGLGVARWPGLRRLPGDTAGFAHQAVRYQHARGGAAGLTGVLHHQADALRYRVLEVSILKDDIGTLAAKFLVDALDCRRSRARHLDTGARGAGNGDHGDLRMRRHRRADHGPFALDQVEYARGQVGRMNDFGEYLTGKRGNLRRLEHDGAPCGYSRGDLGADLVDRPVPGRNQPADADGFHDDSCGTPVFREAEIPESRDGRLEMPHAHRRLHALREPGGRSHLFGNGGGQIADPFLKFCEYSLQRLESFLPGRGAPNLCGRA